MKSNDWRDCDAPRELPFKSFWIADFQGDDCAGFTMASDRAARGGDAPAAHSAHRARFSRRSDSASDEARRQRAGARADGCAVAHGQCGAVCEPGAVARAASAARRCALHRRQRRCIAFLVRVRCPAGASGGQNTSPAAPRLRRRDRRAHRLRVAACGCAGATGQSTVARTPRMPARSPCVILGAGATGLAAAYYTAPAAHARRARGENRRRLSFDRGYGVHVRPRRACDGIRRPAGAGPVPAAPRRQRPLAGMRRAGAGRRRRDIASNFAPVRYSRAYSRKAT